MYMYNLAYCIQLNNSKRTQVLTSSSPFEVGNVLIAVMGTHGDDLLNHRITEDCEICIKHPHSNNNIHHKRETDKQTDRQTDRQRQRETETERDRDRPREKQ